MLSAFAMRAVFLFLPTEMCVLTMFLGLLTDMECISCRITSELVNTLPGRDTREGNRAQPKCMGDAHDFQTRLEAGFAELLQMRRYRITCCW